MFSPTVLVITVWWPDRDGKGIHSPKGNQISTITLDGRPLWAKRTTHRSAANDYYAAEHAPIVLTVVLRNPGRHTLRFAVPPQTAWDVSGITIKEYPLPRAIRGVAYSPYRDCQSADTRLQPTITDVEEDLFRLAHTSTAIRTYSSTGVNRPIPAAAKALGLQVFAGAWLDSAPDDAARSRVERDRAEIDGVVDIAHAVQPDGLIVGNEYYLRHNTLAGAQYLARAIAEVRRRTADKRIPIMTGENVNVIFEYPEGMPDAIEPIKIKDDYRAVVDSVDILLVHIYPFWNQLPVDGAAAFTVDRYKAIQRFIEREYPGGNKRVVLGEAGWPSSGAPYGAAVPSPANQQRYLREFLALAEVEGVDYFHFQMSDELWKTDEPGRVGQRWGYTFADRTAKYNHFGVLIPTAALPNLDLVPDADGVLPLADESGLRFEAAAEWPGKTHVEHIHGRQAPPQFVPSGFIGDINNVSVFECDRSGPHSGELSIRATFQAGGPRGWAGVYWQYPEHNWGDKADGLNLSWATKLTFWARGERGGERVRFFVGGIGGAGSPYPDSVRPEVSTGFVRLEPTWRQYTLNLRGQDLSHMVGGFGWTTDSCANPSGATFFLDDIVYEFDPDLPLPAGHGPRLPVYTDAAAPDNHFTPSGWMGGVTFPGAATLTECWTDNPHSGTTAIRITYDPMKVPGSWGRMNAWWAGMYWVHPAENWGDRPGGLDLTGAKRLTFWARSERDGERVTFIIGGVGYARGWLCGGQTQPYPDSVCPWIGQTETLSTTWRRYVIDLTKPWCEFDTSPSARAFSLTPMDPDQCARDLSRVVAGFGWFINYEVGLTIEDKPIFYLDDIMYEFE
ncbi:MAG: glycosyl hydrolase family 17 protein [Dehalococcoidia bacterium]